MKYKLIVADIDGTLIPNLGMPPRKFTASSKLKNAVEIWQKYRKFSLCTGRDKKTAIEVSDELKLNSYHVIEGGSTIIDRKGKILSSRYISKSSMIRIIELLEKTQLSFSVVVNSVEILDEIPKDNLDKVTAILWYEANPVQITQLKATLSILPDIGFSVNKDRKGNTLYLTHKEGTKIQGVTRLIKLLGYQKNEVIGIGDGNNDIGLLKACGLKVAMGNAVPELKKIADYVAPSVVDDGVVDAIIKNVIQ